MDLYERIKLAAKEKNTSINSLEKELGFARSSISKFKVNTPSADKVMMIANSLDVSLDYLITGKEKEFEMFSEENADLLVKITKNKNAMRLMEYYMRLSDMDKEEIEMMVAYKANKKE